MITLLVFVLLQPIKLSNSKAEFLAYINHDDVLLKYTAIKGYKTFYH